MPKRLLIYIYIYSDHLKWSQLFGDQEVWVVRTGLKFLQKKFTCTIELPVDQFLNLDF